MNDSSVSSQTPSTSRRGFLHSSATAAGATAMGTLALDRSVHAVGNGVIRFGLIGCGGRGTGAATNAMNAAEDVRLVAMADIFEERLKGSRERLAKAKPGQVEVKDDQCFIGFDAYEKVLASDVDAVLIAPASHFIPAIFKAAVDAGKHVFCEKPHGIDIPGMKLCKEVAERAKQKGLSVVSGLCWRYEPGVQETIKRVHDGAIGEIVAIQENYLSSPYGLHERLPGQSEMEWQMWNWYHFNWLSGDQTSQQLVHSLDKASWALGDKPPLRVSGMGGRQTAVDPMFGDQFDHHAVVFEYENGVRVFGFTRDQTDCYRDTNDYILGTKGRCNLLKYTIEGETNWSWEQPRGNMYDLEQKAFFDSIRSGTPVNNGHYMCLSSALGIAAQIACYTGAMLTWEEVMRSKRSFALPRYAFDVDPPVKPGPDGRYPAAMQGKEEFEHWLI